VFAIGAGLREARERQGLSLEQAAEATRIAARHLRALEEERFERLPEPVYARGFLREYAGFLGLDAGRSSTSTRPGWESPSRHRSRRAPSGGRSGPSG